MSAARNCEESLHFNVYFVFFTDLSDERLHFTDRKKVFVDLIDLYIRLINRIDKKYLLIKKLLITFEMSLCLIHLNTQLSLAEVFFRTQLFES